MLYVVYQDAISPCTSGTTSALIFGDSGRVSKLFRTQICIDIAKKVYYRIAIAINYLINDFKNFLSARGEPERF